MVEESDGLFLLGEIVCDTNFAVSETKIDLRKTIQALDGQVTIGYHNYPRLPLAALVERMLQCVGEGERDFSVARQNFPQGLVADDAPIAPTDIATAVNDLMARHGKMTIASDMGRLPVYGDGDRAYRIGRSPAITRRWVTAFPPASAFRRRLGSGR